MTTAQVQDLVRSAQCGDPKALASLVVEWEPLVRRVVRRLLSDPFDEDDVVQESLLSALLRIGQLRDAGRSVQWLSTTARNMAVSFIRRPRAQRLLDETAGTSDLESVSEIPRMRLLVRLATANLSALRRDAVVWHYYRGLSYVETAEAAGVPVDTIRSRLQKARDALKEAITNMPEQKPERYTLSAQDVSTLRLMVEATTVDERHPELQGVLLDSGGWAVATDGRRLLKRRIGGLRDLSVPILLGPWYGADTLFVSGAASLAIRTGTASFQTGAGGSHEIGIMTATFPNYHAAIPGQTPACSVAVAAAAVRHALARLSPDAAGGHSAMTIEVADGLLTLGVRWPQYASEGTVRLATAECSCESGLFSVCLDARYVESSIRGLEPTEGDSLRVSLYGEDRPVKLALARQVEEIALVAPLARKVAA